MNEKMYNVSSSPHVRDKSSTNRIMIDVCIALLPACVFGVVNFGFRCTPCIGSIRNIMYFI